MIDVMQAVKKNPMLIWDLHDVDETIFRAAIEVVPLCVFNEWGSLHLDFDLDRYSDIVGYILESVSGIEVDSEGLNLYQVKQHAVMKDWRILGLLPDPDERLQLIAVNLNPDALKYINKLTPTLQLLALDDVEGCYRVLYQCGKLSKQVAGKAKRFLLKHCQVYSESNWTPEYAAKYLYMATDSETQKFLADESLACLLRIEEFHAEDPSDAIKKFFIERKGVEFVLFEMPDCWTISSELRLWIARRMNRDQVDGYPDIFHLQDPSQQEVGAFICSLLKISDKRKRGREGLLVGAIKQFPDIVAELCWLCWALVRKNSSTVAMKTLVARLCGLSGNKVASFQKSDLSVAFQRLSGHWDNRGIEAALEMIGRLFPEMAGLYAVASMFDDDLGKRCQYLQNSLMKGSAESVRETRVECDDLFEIDF